VIPWFVITIASYVLTLAVLMPAIMQAATGTGTSAALSRRMALFPMLIAAVGAVLSLGKDIFFLTMTRRKLYSEFREMAVRIVAPIHFSPPKPVASPLIPPPVASAR
jgi:hypothetical protein